LSASAKIKIYDPRSDQQFSQNSDVGPPWFGPNPHCLAIELPPCHPATINNDFWVEFLNQFKCEMLSLHVDFMGKLSKTRKQLQTTLGKKSPRKKQYFAVFDYSEQAVNQIIKNYIQLGNSEEWIVGGFHTRKTSEVENMKFEYLGEREDFFRDIRLFNFILSFNLDWHDARVVCTKEEWFDDIISFFIDRYPTRDGLH